MLWRFFADDQLVSGSCDGSVKVWSMDTLKCVHTLESHTADINCIVAKVLYMYNIIHEIVQYRHM